MIVSIEYSIENAGGSGGSEGMTYAEAVRAGVMTPEEAIEAMNNPPPDPADAAYVARLKLGLDIARAVDAWWKAHKEPVFNVSFRGPLSTPTEVERQVRESLRAARAEED